VTARVELLGGATFARTVHALADDVRHLVAGHTAAGAAVVELARARARRRTGALAASFTAEPADTGVRIGSHLVYAGVQEYGWARHSISPSRALTSALADSAGRVADAYTAALTAAVSKVRGR
jgi:hypothetical protein